MAISMFIAMVRLGKQAKERLIDDRNTGDPSLYRTVYRFSNVRKRRLATGCLCVFYLA